MPLRAVKQPARAEQLPIGVGIRVGRAERTTSASASASDVLAFVGLIQFGSAQVDLGDLTTTIFVAGCLLVVLESSLKLDPTSTSRAGQLELDGLSGLVKSACLSPANARWRRSIVRSLARSQYSDCESTRLCRPADRPKNH